MEEKITAETNFTTEIAESGNEERVEEVKQTPEQNREFARIRRNQEKEHFEKEISDRVRLSTAKEILDNINPFTNKELSSLEDLDEFLQLKKNKNEDITNQVEKEKAWYQKDKAKFFEINPDFDEQKFRLLMEDEDFNDFSNGKIGKIPLNEIYKEYNLFLKKIEDLANQKAQKMYLKKLSSPGSLTSSYMDKNFQWNDMSEQEFERAISNAKKGYYTSKK